MIVNCLSYVTQTYVLEGFNRIYQISDYYNVTTHVTRGVKSLSKSQRPTRHKLPYLNLRLALHRSSPKSTFRSILKYPSHTEDIFWICQLHPPSILPYNRVRSEAPNHLHYQVLPIQLFIHAVYTLTALYIKTGAAVMKIYFQIVTFHKVLGHTVFFGGF